MTVATPLDEEDDPVPAQLWDSDTADERAVVATRFPETQSRPPWQFLVDDIEAKLQELRAAVENILSTVLPFLHPHADESYWECDDPAEPDEVRAIMHPD